MQPPFIIGIAGGTGSGKTTVSHYITSSVATENITSISHDNYYCDQSSLSMEERVKTNYDHPNSLESSLLAQHLDSLKHGQTIHMPTYDFVHHTRAKEMVEISPTPIIVVEGILIFASEELLPFFDLKIFVDTDADIRFIRRLKRDINDRGRSLENVINQYTTTVRPMHLEFVEPSKRMADVIIPEGGYNTKALGLLTARIKEVVMR